MAGTAAFALTMATSAMAVPPTCPGHASCSTGGGGGASYTPPIIADTGLGFGLFLGTWKQTPPSGSDMPNPTATNVAEVGDAILIAHPGLFDINDFHLAGVADNYDTSVANTNPAGTGFRVDSKLDAYTAKWTYEGFAAAGLFPPGNDPVELFIAVKYATFISVFMYEFVDPSVLGGAYGYLSSDFATILANTEDSLETGLNYGGFSSSCGLGAGDFSASCMMYNPSGTSPLGISHVTAYWPPVAASVPEPVTLSLLGFGLAGLAGVVRNHRRGVA